VKYYLDEDISPKIADLLRKQKVDCVSAHERCMTQASDLQQLEMVVKEERCLVTRNRNDFIRLTVQFFNSQLHHYGVLIIPYSYPGDHFSLIAKALKNYAQQHPDGLGQYTIDFL